MCAEWTSRTQEGGRGVRLLCTHTHTHTHTLAHTQCSVNTQAHTCMCAEWPSGTQVLWTDGSEPAEKKEKRRKPVNLPLQTPRGPLQACPATHIHSYKIPCEGTNVCVCPHSPTFTCTRRAHCAEWPSGTLKGSAAALLSALTTTDTMRAAGAPPAMSIPLNSPSACT